MSDLAGLRVYITGPISSILPGVTMEEKKERFYKAADELKFLGAYPVNPLTVVPQCGGTCDPKADQISQATGTGDPDHSWACWMRYDLMALLDCDAYLPLPQWTESKGAMLETEIAAQLKMRRIYYTYKYGAFDAIH